MVPNQFGPPGQMVPRIFCLSRAPAGGQAVMIWKYGDHLSRGTEFLGTICPWIKWVRNQMSHSQNLCLINNLKIFWPQTASAASDKKCQNSKLFLLNFQGFEFKHPVVRKCSSALDFCKVCDLLTIFELYIEVRKYIFNMKTMINLI